MVLTRPYPSKYGLLHGNKPKSPGRMDGGRQGANVSFFYKNAAKRIEL